MEFMLKKWFKKKITVNQLAQLYVGKMMQLVDHSFADVVAIIEMDPDFEQIPDLKDQNSNAFLLIVCACNEALMADYFNEQMEDALKEAIHQHFAKVFNMTVEDFNALIANYQKFLNKVNHPSKNVLYAMSKAVFHKYNLNQYQNEFFRSQNNPNPMLMKRLDEVMKMFVWDWDFYLKSFHIQNC